MIIEGAAPEVQNEFDRLWSELDRTNQYVDELEQRLTRGRGAGIPVVEPLVQHGPAVNYGLPAEFDCATQPCAEGPCGCEEAVALRKSIRDVLYEAGLSADVDEGRDPIDAARSLRRDINSAQDEGVALRAEVERLNAELYNERGVSVAKSNAIQWRDAILSSATALLERINRVQPKALGGDVKAFLTGQPVAHWKPGCGRCPDIATCCVSGCKGCADGPAATDRCEHIDGGPMGSDARCSLRAGHSGGCLW